jgi:hypothetical protein
LSRRSKAGVAIQIRVLRGNEKEKMNEHNVTGRNQDRGEMVRWGEGYHDFESRRGEREENREVRVAALEDGMLDGLGK